MPYILAYATKRLLMLRIWRGLPLKHFWLLLSDIVIIGSQEHHVAVVLLRVRLGLRLPFCKWIPLLYLRVLKIIRAPLWFFGVKNLRRFGVLLYGRDNLVLYRHRRQLLLVRRLLLLGLISPKVLILVHRQVKLIFKRSIIVDSLK